MIETWKKASFSQDWNCVEVGWRKSSFSADFGGSCVETNQQSNVKIRNSNHPDRCVLEFSAQAMTSWIEGIKNNELDDLA